jgi:hypothetical protein
MRLIVRAAAAVVRSASLRRHQTVLACVVLATTACGDNRPSSPSPSAMSMAGQWTYTHVLTEVTDGGCVGDSLRMTLGSRETGTMEIAQSDNRLAVTTRSDSTGQTCEHVGNFTNGTAFISPLRAAIRCMPEVIPHQCSSGEMRDVHLRTRLIQGVVSARGHGFEGMTGDNIDIWLPGTRWYPPTGSNLRTLSTFSAIRR